MKNIIIIFLLTTLNNFSQGKIDGFYRGKGNATVVLSYGFEDSNHYYIGKTKSDIKRTAYYYNIYSSFGMTENLDIQVALPYISSKNNNDFQDIAFFMKYRFYKKNEENHKLELSFGSGFSTPVSDYSIGGQYDIGQQATIIDTRLMMHYQWNKNWFTTLQSGYSFKLEESPNSVPLTLKIGVAKNNYYYDFYYDYQYSFGGTDYRGSPPPQNFREFGVDYHKIGGTFYAAIFNNFGTYINLSYLLLGRNTYQGPAYGVGLVYDYRK